MTEIRYIDINCDVGEGVGNEQELLPLISSCSIACGGHAGDNTSMREVVRLALENNVRIGAHPSYPDKKNFGRVSMAISPDALITSIKKQITDLVAILKTENAVLKHIKPHGALYNDLAKDLGLATVFLAAVAAYKDSVSIYVPFGSQLEKCAIAKGFNITREAFADRNYNTDMSLVGRKHPAALITNPQDVFDHLVLMVCRNQVRSIDNKLVGLHADTFCLHGDTPNVLEILAYLNERLPTPEINIHISK